MNVKLSHPYLYEVGRREKIRKNQNHLKHLNMEEREEWARVPISCLSRDSRNVLSSLNHLRVIPTEPEKLSRDWRGLAHLALGAEGPDRPESRTFGGLGGLGGSPAPTADLLSAWQRLDLPLANVRLLCEHLERLDRFDVLDDVAPHLERDVADYLAGNMAPSHSQIEVTQELLTVDDANSFYCDEPSANNIARYHAFILYADEDVQFVGEVRRNMGALGYKFCTRDDLLPGNKYEHLSMRDVIVMRCESLIIVLSPQFNNNLVFDLDCVNFTHGISIQNNKIKLIPIIYKFYTEVPPMALSFICPLNYVRMPRATFWEKLALALSLPKSTSILSDETSELSRSISSGSQMNISRSNTPTTQWSVYHALQFENGDAESGEIITNIGNISVPIESNVAPVSREAKKKSGMKTLRQKISKILTIYHKNGKDQN